MPPSHQEAEAALEQTLADVRQQAAATEAAQRDLQQTHAATVQRAEDLAAAVEQLQAETAQQQAELERRAGQVSELQGTVEAVVAQSGQDHFGAIGPGGSFINHIWYGEPPEMTSIRIP